MDNFKEVQGDITGCTGMRGGEQALKEVTRDKGEERGIQEKKGGKRDVNKGLNTWKNRQTEREQKVMNKGAKECEDGANQGSNRMVRGVQGRERAVQY